MKNQLKPTAFHLGDKVKIISKGPEVYKVVGFLFDNGKKITIQDESDNKALYLNYSSEDLERVGQWPEKLSQEAQSVKKNLSYPVPLP